MANAENFDRRRAWFRERFGYDRSVVLAREINAQRATRAFVPRAVRSPWQSIGPANCNGRVTGLALDTRNPSILYVGCSGGGVWVTKDDGLQWFTGMDSEASIAIGAIAANPFSGEVFAATGEWTGGIGWGVDPMLSGRGVYKSSDQGATWQPLGPIVSNQCSSIQVLGPQKLLVSGNAGLELSTDGGLSWTFVPTVAQSDISDVQVDEADTSFVVAGIDRQEIVYSQDGGLTWQVAAAGLPSGWQLNSPKINISRPYGRRRILIKAGDALFISEDDCASFSLLTEFQDAIMFYGWCNIVSADPREPKRILAGSNNLYLSENGGTTWVRTAGYKTAVHPDQQAVVWSPDVAEKCYLANDGGVYLSEDGGRTWSNIGDGIIGGHFYCMGASHKNPAMVAGAVQDDGGYRGEVGSAKWKEMPLGEGGYVEFDPQNTKIIYHDTWFSNLNRSDDGGLHWRDLGIDTDYYYLEPLAIDANDPQCIAAITKLNSIMLSSDRGDSWKEILRPPITLRAVRFGVNAGASFVFVAGYGGNAWISLDRGFHWKTIDLSILGDILHADTLLADGRSLVIATRTTAGFGLKVVSFTADWSSFTVADAFGNLPAVAQSLMPSAISAHHSSGHLFLLNLAGLFASDDQGATWSDWTAGLPNVFVSDIDAPQGADWLYASTLGRGIFRRCINQQGI